MNENKNLNELLKSPIPEVVTAAQHAILLNDRYARKEITLSEYNELIDDIARLDRIDKAMFKEEVFIAIKKAYEIIKALRIFSPSF
jgi:hypothetical protein